MSYTGPPVEVINRQYLHAQRSILIIFLLGIVANIFLWWYASEERPGRTIMFLELTGEQTVPVVCPGETVDISYTVHILEAGVFELNQTLWRVTPPSTMLFGRTDVGVYPAPITFPAERRWLVPKIISNPVDGSPIALPPGQYEFRWAMSTVSRSTVPSILVVPFEVSEDCEDD